MPASLPAYGGPSNAEACAGELAAAAAALYDAFLAGFQEACASPASGGTAEDKLASLLGLAADNLPGALAQANYALGTEEGLGKAAADFSGGCACQPVGRRRWQQPEGACLQAWLLGSLRCAESRLEPNAPRPPSLPALTRPVAAPARPYPCTPATEVIWPNVEDVMLAAVASCPSVNALPASPLPFPDSSPAADGSAPATIPTTSSGQTDLGEWGAAVLPNLEAARHDAFMQILGRRR